MYTMCTFTTFSSFFSGHSDCQFVFLSSIANVRSVELCPLSFKPSSVRSSCKGMISLAFSEIRSHQKPFVNGDPKTKSIISFQ